MAASTAVAAGFMAEVEVASTAVAASAGAGFVEADFMAVADTVAVARFAAEGIAAATSAARDLMVEAPTEVARSWAAGALDLVDPADSDAASMLQVADTEAATATGLPMRSRTATGILLGALEAP
ncbi:MAG TPA: hypothetical protein VGR97_11090 [Candidatus Acidoferrales bacterium]|nr:hypothetical protein [Candidatus Acidoferrales bacterium]